MKGRSFAAVYRLQQPFQMRQANDGCAAYTGRTGIRLDERLVYDTSKSIYRSFAKVDDRLVSGRPIVGLPDQLGASTDEVFHAIRQLMCPAYFTAAPLI